MQWNEFFLKKKLRKEFLILLTLCKLLNGIKKDFKFIVKKRFLIYFILKRFYLYFVKKNFSMLFYLRKDFFTFIKKVMI